MAEKRKRASKASFAPVFSRHQASGTGHHSSPITGESSSIPCILYVRGPRTNDKGTRTNDKDQTHAATGSTSSSIDNHTYVHFSLCFHKIIWGMLLLIVFDTLTFTGASGRLFWIGFPGCPGLLHTILLVALILCRLFQVPSSAHL